LYRKYTGDELPEPSIWTRPAPLPRRRSLSREAIVTAAVTVADQGGLDALTMHAVARTLGEFTPMSLYRYVYSKEGLVDLMLESVLAEIELPAAAGADWRAAVFDLERATWAALQRHPWFAQLVHTRPPLGPNALRRTEFLLGIFAGLGADLGTAMGYLSLVERLVIGMALQAATEAQAQPQADFTTPEGTSDAIAPLVELTQMTDAYPHLAEWARSPGGPNPTEQLELGLTMFLDGIAARHSAPQR
jgi:AcrR family transcriptional regulator